MVKNVSINTRTALHPYSFICLGKLHSTVTISVMLMDIVGNVCYKIWPSGLSRNRYTFDCVPFLEMLNWPQICSRVVWLYRSIQTSFIIVRSYLLQGAAILELRSMAPVFIKNAISYTWIWDFIICQHGVIYIVVLTAWWFQVWRYSLYGILHQCLSDVRWCLFWCLCLRWW